MHDQSGILTLSRFEDAYNKAIKLVYEKIHHAGWNLKPKYVGKSEMVWFLPFNFLDQELENCADEDKPQFCNNLALFFLHIDDVLCCKYQWLQGTMKYRYSYQIIEYYLALNDRTHNPVQSHKMICLHAVDELKKCISGQIEYFGPATPEQDICFIRKKMKDCSSEKHFSAEYKFIQDMFKESLTLDKENLVPVSTIEEFHRIRKEYLDSKHMFHSQLSINRSSFMKPILEKAARDENWAYDAYMCFERERYCNERDQVAEASGIDTTIFDYRP
ncbi:MAG: hypothetical protein LHV68_04195 [Elusimicrobia bacterium]|nr:hypothetical protein [Candidatus Liberimonas magnetica]